MNDQLESIIWRFRTREGSVRLNVAARSEDLADLHGELRGCATVAETFEEFISLAVRATLARDGIVGDALRQPWPTRSLVSGIRAAATESAVTGAAAAILDASYAADSAEVDALLDDPDHAALLDFVLGVVIAMDEHQERFVADLANALRVSPERLGAAFDRVRGSG